MFGSAILDIATGLIFVFLLLSLICSAANELAELVLKKRAKDLERGIKELIGDPDNTTKFIDDIYNHGLVNSLFRGTYGQTSGYKLPSYIPSRNFALALIDVYQKSNAIIDAIKAGKIEKPAILPKIPANVTGAFETFTKSAEDGTQHFQSNIEDWYNSSMDRVSGWYKRRTQIILLFIGAGISIGANVDSIQIAKKLSSDASLRQGIVALADATGKKDITKQDDTKSIDVIRDEIKTLDGLGLPMGWPPKTPENQHQDWQTSILEALQAHCFGWLITTLAVSLGAPFWFDMLNKIMVVRSTVKPKEKSKDEKSKS